MAKYFDKESLKLLKRQLETHAREQSEFLFNRNNTNKNSDQKIYWPSRENPVLWSFKHSEHEMYMGLELWLQHLYDLRPDSMPRKPLNGYNTNKARFRFWGMLSDKWNQGNLTIEFIEIE